jgi:hypothetical protein
VQVFLGDDAFFLEPASEVRDGAAVGTVGFTRTEAAWGTGLFKCRAEGQILFLCG